MSSFLSLHSGTIASFAGMVSSSPRNGQSPLPGCSIPLLSQVETSYGTVIGKSPHGLPGTHRDARRIGHGGRLRRRSELPDADRSSKVGIEFSRRECMHSLGARWHEPRPDDPRGRAVGNRVTLEVDVDRVLDRHVVACSRSVDGLADFEVPGVRRSCRARADRAGGRSCHPSGIAEMTVAPACEAASTPFWVARCCAITLPPSTTNADARDQREEPSDEDDEDLTSGAFASSSSPLSGHVSPQHVTRGAGGGLAHVRSTGFFDVDVTSTAPIS